ncbi:MAG: glycosyltransferase family 2 protein [Chloroflexota bacterium]
MSSSPRVSAIIINYNYAHFLPQAIESVRSQDYPNIEIVVVDDGSTDNSREIIESYGSDVVSVFKANGGSASAHNAGYAACSGEIIALLDADDLFLPNKISRIVEVMEEHPDAGACFHTLRRADEHLVPFSGIPSLGQEGYCDFRHVSKKGKMPQFSTATSGLCFRRALLDQLYPAPEISSMPSSGDHYVKWGSIYLSPLFFLDEPLSLQRIHANNLYTGKSDRRTDASPQARAVYAQHLVITACWLRERFPGLGVWCDKIFSLGVLTFARIGGPNAEFRDYIGGYTASLSTPERFRLRLFTAYTRVRP